ncbi:DUF3021 domain-containing protein [Anaerotignum sp.]|uniref:DUF3021 domain-containing protein n=1 Tax=Anaerotignum sp. TaxID=2039241 RepID=UPI002714A1A3|nr:DUF3021 domain-containing protein [Anaerotignum sp.]
MRKEELLKKMIDSFFMITTGVVISMYVFCLIFNPDVKFTLVDIGRIIVMAVVSDLPFLIFLCRRELDKKQMLIRNIIHFIVLSAILLYFAFLWDWVNPRDGKEITVFLVSVLLVYAAVFLTNRYRDRKLSDKLNDRLKQRYGS